MRTIQSIEDILKRPYFMLFSVLLFFTPLVFSQSTNELFEFPKMFFVYLFGFFIITFFLSDLILNPVKVKRPNITVTLFFIFIFISSVFSTHRYTSLFGYYSRFNDSLLSYLVYFGLYFVAINKLNKNNLEKILKISLFTLVPIAVFGLSQYFNGTTRVFSTLGQPNWLAQYISLLLPLVLYYSLTENSKNFKIWFAVYIFGFYCLWVTYSISGILGLVLSIFLLFFVTRKIKLLPRDIKKRILLIVIMTVFIPLSHPGLFKDKVSDVFMDIKKQVANLNRVYAQDSSNKISDPGFIRLKLWKSSLSLIFSNPKIFLISAPRQP